MNCCKEIIDCLEEEKPSDSGKILKLSKSGFQDRKFDSSPLKPLLNVQKVGEFLANGEHSDINIYVSGHGLVTKGHRLILSLWSAPLAKVHTFSFMNPVSYSNFGIIAHFFINNKVWPQMFVQMFTNGMKESSATDIFFGDVPPEPFFLLLRFMYYGELKLDSRDTISVLVQLLLLADQFAITVLQFECCKRIMKYLSEVLIFL